MTGKLYVAIMASRLTFTWLFTFIFSSRKRRNNSNVHCPVTQNADLWGGLVGDVSLYGMKFNLSDPGNVAVLISVREQKMS